MTAADILSAGMDSDGALYQTSLEMSMTSTVKRSLSPPWPPDHYYIDR